MFGKKRTRPTPEQLELRDDIEEARALKEAVTGELEVLGRKATLISRLTDPIIDRQGQNHYIETLFTHYPRKKAS